jgi:hypothetical protein
MYAKFWSKNLREEHSEDLGIDGRIILQWILGKCGEGVEWMHLAQDRDMYWTLRSGEFLY